MFLAKELLKTMRCVLNDKKIQSMKASHKRQELRDLSLPSFGLRVSKSGQRSFFVMCRENGKQKRVSLGKYPLVSLSEARDLARDKLRLVSQGLPLEEKKPELITVDSPFQSHQKKILVTVSCPMMKSARFGRRQRKCATLMVHLYKF